MVSTAGDGRREGCRSNMMLFHQGDEGRASQGNR